MANETLDGQTSTEVYENTPQIIDAHVNDAALDFKDIEEAPLKQQDEKEEEKEKEVEHSGETEQEAQAEIQPIVEANTHTNDKVEAQEEQEESPEQIEVVIDEQNNQDIFDQNIERRDQATPLFDD